MELVKSKDFGTTYPSYNSDAISKVTFYNVMIEYQTYYFAIVCFKGNNYSILCTEYIYQVSSTTEMEYAMHYLASAGKAFWSSIQPYNKQLGCGPDL